jgi:hypothetical protein
MRRRIGRAAARRVGSGGRRTMPRAWRFCGLASERPQLRAASLKASLWVSSGCSCAHACMHATMHTLSTRATPHAAGARLGVGARTRNAHTPHAHAHALAHSGGAVGGGRTADLLDARDLRLHEQVVLARRARRAVEVLLLALAPSAAAADAASASVERPHWREAGSRGGGGGGHLGLLHRVLHRRVLRQPRRHLMHARHGRVRHHLRVARGDGVGAGDGDLELSTGAGALRDDDHVLLARRRHDDHLLTDAHIGWHIDQHERDLRVHLIEHRLLRHAGHGIAGRRLAGVAGRKRVVLRHPPRHCPRHTGVGIVLRH